MQENLDPSFANIHFPQRTSLIKNLRYVSFIVNDIILITSLLVLLVWILNIQGIYSFLFQKVAIFPFSSILFILCGLALLFGAKRHRMAADESKEEAQTWWHTVIPISLAGTTAVLGLLSVLQLNTTGILSVTHMPQYVGLYFFLIGCALVPPFTRILHRFHITQLLIFIVSSVSVFSVLEKIYQLFSPLPLQHIISVSLTTDVAIILLCFGILLRWSNRGFFGNFTLNSTGSIFAFRLFLISLIGQPLIAFIVLLLMQNTSFNMYQVLALLVACSTCISCMLLWMNVQLLYGYELEHLLMRESLHMHNIDLATEKEALKKSMTQLEQEKQQYVDKLNVQSRLRDVTDTLG